MKMTDIIGELRPKGAQPMSSTMLVSGLDSLFLSTEGVYNFAESGAGALAHASVHRSLYYLTLQYPEFSHNLMSYFSKTRYSDFLSVDLFFKKNDHSHFTSGISEIVVLKTLSSTSRNLRCVVYNVDEANQLEFTYLDSLRVSAQEKGLNLVVEFKSSTFFQQFSGPTVVIEDLPALSKEASQTQLQTKIEVLTSFFISQVYGVSSKVILSIKKFGFF